MIIRFSTKTNKNGWQYQLEIDTDKKQYQCGSYLFQTADVNLMTKKQLEEIEEALLANDYTLIIKV